MRLEPLESMALLVAVRLRMNRLLPEYWFLAAARAPVRMQKKTAE